MFRRRRQAEDELDDQLEGDVDDDDLDDDEGDDEDAALPEPPPRPQGPWDVEDAPALGEEPELDLGALRLRRFVEMDVQMQTAEDHTTVVSVAFVRGQSQLQVMAFAAPRTTGIWSEVRAEIATAIRADGGQAREQDGPLGTEILASVPVRTNDGLGGSVRTTMQPTRFIGVDGPRWFLRGVISGAAAADPQSPELAPLLEAFRATVVVRGKEAFAPRDLLPLRLPREAVQVAQEQPERPVLGRPERGPEITETR